MNPKIVKLYKDKRLGRFEGFDRKGRARIRIKDYIVIFDPKTEECVCSCKGYYYHKKCYHCEFVKMVWKIINEKSD